MTVFGMQITLWKEQPKPMAVTFSRPKTLRDLPANAQAKVTGFSPRIPKERQEQLQAYGVMPGYRVKVVQRTPVYVVQVDQLELAIEPELAAEVLVEEI